MTVQRIFAIAFMSFIAGATPAMAQSITLTTQAAVDNFDLSEVTGDLNIFDDGSDPITNLDGLSGLTSVGNVLRINFNSSLTDVDGLSGLSSVRFLAVFFNPMLTDLDGLSGLTTANIVLINSNMSLAGYCGLFPLVEAGGPTLFHSIAGNAMDPTLAEILTAGPCDPADTIQDLLDEGAINRGMARGLLNHADNSPETLAGMLNGFVNAGILTVSEAQLLLVIAII